MNLHFVGMTWSWGVGDPTVTAWLITILYLAAAGLCHAAATIARRADRPVLRTAAACWLVPLAMCLLLGVNKQLDLHAPVLQSLAETATGLGLAARLTALQVIGVALVAAVVAMAARRVVRRAWPAWNHLGPALAGCGLLCLCGLAHLAPGRFVDPFVSQRYLGVDVGNWLELIGAGLIAIAAGRLVLFSLAAGRRSTQADAAWTRVRGLVHAEAVAVRDESPALQLVRPPAEAGDESCVIGYVGRG